MKLLKIAGTSLDDLRDFLENARQRAGYQLHKVQTGRNPSDWKPMKSIGAGVREIRIHAEQSYRVVYVAKFGETVYVLYAFQKKTQKTTQRDLEIARQRYQAILSQHRS